MSSMNAQAGDVTITEEEAAANEARIRANRMAEVSRYAQHAHWLLHIEPEARESFLATGDTEHTIAVSIAISLKRLADPGHHLHDVGRNKELPSAGGGDEISEDRDDTADFTHEGEWTNVDTKPAGFWKSVAADDTAGDKTRPGGDNKSRKARGGYKGRGKDKSGVKPSGDKPKSLSAKLKSRRPKRKKGAIKTPFD